MRLTIYFLLLLPNLASACSCFFTEYFCDYISLYQSDEAPVSIVRVDFLEFRAAEDGRLPLYDLEILEVYAGTYAVGDTVSLLGQDGLNCNGPIIQMAAGEEYMLFFSESDQYFSAWFNPGEAINPYPIHDFPGCGDGAMRTNEDGVVGKLAEGVGFVAKDQFSALLLECLPGDFVLSEDDFDPDRGRIDARVYPNPAVDRLTVSLNQEVVVRDAQIFDLRGRRWGSVAWPASGSTRKFDLDLAELASGVYFLVVYTELGIVRERLVVR